MQHLIDRCHEFRQSLARLGGICQRIQDNVEQFDNIMESYAFQRLFRRLYLLSGWILAYAKSLYIQHQGQGYVCVFLKETNGFSVYWVKEEKIVADKAYYAQNGSKVLSVEEASSLIDGIMGQLGSGNWAEVVDWVKKYAKSPGLVLSKYSAV